MRVALAALAAAVVLAGCGSEGTEGGGRVAGDNLVIYSFLPDTPVARDIVDGEKLAIAEAGGRAGDFTINFAVAHEPPSGPERIASATREIVHDLQISAVIGDLDSQTARTTVPLFNAAGILHVSPGATYPGFVAAFPGGPKDEPARWQPARKRTFAPLAPIDPVQAEAIAGLARPPVLLEGEADDLLAEELQRRLAGRLTGSPRRARTIVYAGTDPDSARGVIESLAREAPRARILLPEALLRAGLEVPEGVNARFLTSAPAPDAALSQAFQERFGRCATRYARLGHDAMASLIETIEKLGDRARERPLLAETWIRDNPPPTAFEAVRSSPCPPA